MLRHGKVAFPHHCASLLPKVGLVILGKRAKLSFEIVGEPKHSSSGRNDWSIGCLSTWSGFASAACQFLAEKQRHLVGKLRLQSAWQQSHVRFRIRDSIANVVPDVADTYPLTNCMKPAGEPP